MDKSISGNLSLRTVFIVVILMAAMVVGIGPVFAQPAHPTELAVSLLNLDGSNIDVSLLLTVCYTNGDGYPECEYSTNFPANWFWSTSIPISFLDGKSSFYGGVSALDGTNITITIDGYEPLEITAIEYGQVLGTYYLTNVTPIPPTTTTTTVPTTTTTITTTTSTSTTTSTTTTTIGLAKISFDPDPKDFGAYTAPASDTRSFNIINSGDGPFLGAFSSFISGPNASYFTLLGSPYISVPANSYVNVDVSFNASKPGLYSAVFNLLGEDAPGIAATHTLDLFATIASPGGPTPINSCTTITSPGVYVLNQDISGSSTCITIESNDVIFDGVGHSITGSGSNYGIYVYNGSATLTNVTVENVRVADWQYGIYYRNAENGWITNNTASNNNVGIQIDDSCDNTLSNNTASSNNQYGIYLYSSSNNTLTDNTASNNEYGILVEYSSNDNTLTNNVASNNDIGIYLDDSSNYNTLANNTANSNEYYGIYLYSSSGNTITGNTASNNDIFGIYLDDSSSNTLNDNTISGMTGGTRDNSGVIKDDTGGMAVGIYLNSSMNNSLENNTISDITGGDYGGQDGSGGMGVGIYLDSSKNNSLQDNTISGITGGTGGLWGSGGGMGAGIYFGSSTNNSLQGNTISGITGGRGMWARGLGGTAVGIYLNSSTNNSLQDNTISGITGGIGGGGEWNSVSGGMGAGIYLSSSTNNFLKDNTISGITGGAGSDWYYGGSGGRGGNGVGIYLGSSTKNSLQDNTISGINGGTGGWGADDGGPGGMGAGIYLNSSTNNPLEGNTISDITGGAGGSKGWVGGSGGRGGNGAGIHLSSSTNNSLQDNTISGINGGTGSVEYYGGSGGTGGIGAGIHLGSSTNNSLEGNIVSNITGGAGGVGSPDGADGVGTGIYLTQGADHNKVYNNLFNNTINFNISSSNSSWNTTKTPGTNVIGGPYLGGNFWATPDGMGFSETCTDADPRDGICDSNYTLNYGNVDYLPLAVLTPSINISKVMISGKTTVYTETKEYWVLEIEVSNNDLTNLSNVVVSDTIPEEITLDDFTASKGSVATTVKNGATKLTWTIGTMSPGDTETQVMDVSTRTVGSGMRTTQSFLEPGEYVLNEGASVSGNGGQITAGPTDPITVYAQAKTRRGRMGGGRHSR